MRLFVEALARLYKDRRVTKEKILELREHEKITTEECEYILAD